MCPFVGVRDFSVFINCEGRIGSLLIHRNSYSSIQTLIFQNDLLFLKVTSQLHHLSIKCAIHVLHVNKFNPHCLHRRPADEVRTEHCQARVFRARIPVYKEMKRSSSPYCLYLCLQDPGAMGHKAEAARFLKIL